MINADQAIGFAADDIAIA